jgi:hypothetical protein
VREREIEIDRLRGREGESAERDVRRMAPAPLKNAARAQRGLRLAVLVARLLLLSLSLFLCHFLSSSSSSSE